MLKNKHHYVPRFYLKYFSSQSNRINIYNIKQDKYIQDGRLRDQCYKIKFYGNDDVLENVLASLEGFTANIFKEIISNGRLPVLESNDYAIFLTFIATQLLRTSKAAERLNNSIDMFYKKAYEDDSRLKGINLGDFKIEMENPVLFELKQIPICLYCLDDLAFHLIYSGNHRNFVACDSPIMKYNQFTESFRDIGKTGLLAKGLQIFYPLSPHYLLILYDKDVYNFPGGINITRDITNNDIKQLNLFQFIEADENIYFSKWQQKEQLSILAKLSSRYRKISKVVVETLNEVGNENTSQLIHQYEETPNVNLDLSFLKIKRSLRKIPLSKRINMYRKDLPKEVIDEYTKYGPPPSSPKVFKSKNNNNEVLYKPKV